MCAKSGHTLSPRLLVGVLLLGVSLTVSTPLDEDEESGEHFEMITGRKIDLQPLPLTSRRGNGTAVNILNILRLQDTRGREGEEGSVIVMKGRGDWVTGVNYMFQCQGKRVTSFEGVHCSDLEDCRHFYRCLESQPLKDCVKGSGSGDLGWKLIQGIACPGHDLSKEESGGGDERDCEQMMVDDNRREKLLSFLAECVTGSRGHREVYHYKDEGNFSIMVQQVLAT